MSLPLQYHRDVRRDIVFLADFCRGSALVLLALLAALTPCAVAQRSAVAHGAAQGGRTTPGFNLPTGSFASGHGTRSSRGFRRSSPSYVLPYTSLPFPFFGDSFDPDDIYSTGYPVASQPPVFVLQAAHDMAGSIGAGRPGNDRDTPFSQPLMIELQGDRYVRVNIPAADGEALPLSITDSVQPNDAQSAKSTGNPSARLLAQNSATARAPVSPTVPPHALPSAILVFRDGHSEEVRDYTIANGILYVRGDFYTDGYWNKKIEISTLDVPQTIQANANRSANFVLPSSANEIIARF